MAPTRGQTVLATLPVVFGMPAASLVVGMAASVADKSFSVCAALALFASVALLANLALTRRRLPRAPAAAAIALVPWAVIFAFAAAEKMTELLVSPLAGSRCGTGLMGLVFLLVPAGAVVAVGASIALSFAMTERFLDRHLARLAFAACALGTIASVFAATKTSRPELDSYVDSLPVVARLSVGDRATVAGRELHYFEGEIEQSDPPKAYLPARRCGVEGLLMPDPRVLYTKTDVCPELEVKLDPRGDYLIVGANEPRPQVYAFLAPGFHPVEITPRDVGARVAAPIGWRIAALVTSLLSAIVIVIARRIRSRAAALGERAAIHGGGGWCELAGEANPIHVAAAEHLPRGPVLLGGREDVTAAYRTTGGVSFRTARPGGEHTTSDLVAGLHAVAFTTALLGVTPLVVARFYGV